MRAILTRSAGADSPAGADRPLGASRYATWTDLDRTSGRPAIIDAVREAGLIGKGGAGFPTYRKMQLMADQPGERKVVVLNGSEHEPGSEKDRHLLEWYPDTVLEGALILAYAVGAGRVIVTINELLSVCRSRFEGALHAARAAGLDFAGIEVEVRSVPDVYIVGEETALLEVLEGRAALPRVRPPFPIQQGLDGAPTLIQNIETVAHLPFILSAGAAAYRALGANGNGVTLCTLGEECSRPGIYEVPLGTPVGSIFRDWGGGLKGGQPIKAVQPGGPSSGFLAAADLHLPLDGETLLRHGSALGCAALRAYSVDTCIVAQTSRIMSFFARGCCGQCPRCRMETGMLDTILRRVASGRGNPQLLAQVDKLIELAKGEGICSLIGMPVAPLRSALALFPEEFAAHLEGRCRLCDSSRGAESNLH